MVLFVDITSKLFDNNCIKTEKSKNEKRVNDND